MYRRRPVRGMREDVPLHEPGGRLTTEFLCIRGPASDPNSTFLRRRVRRRLRRVISGDAVARDSSGRASGRGDANGGRTWPERRRSVGRIAVAVVKRSAGAGLTRIAAMGSAAFGAGVAGNGGGGTLSGRSKGVRTGAAAGFAAAGRVATI